MDGEFRRELGYGGRDDSADITGGWSRLEGILINVDFRRRTKLRLVLENSSLIRIHEVISVNSHRQ